MAQRYLYDTLSRAGGFLSAHMPGHGGHAPFDAWNPFALDTTELPVTDDLYAPSGAIAMAQARAARLAGSGASLFLHNGSTQGVHAMLQVYAPEGSQVILPRNAHLSAVSACILGGLEPVWVPAMRLGSHAFVRWQDMVQAMKTHPGARAVLVTRPDYMGGCMPLEEVVLAAHERGMALVADEAHGAHLPFLDGLDSAGALGADAWVQSFHKTLPALTGSAVMHLRREEDAGRALQVLRREQTSSPSFLLMLSADDAAAYMEDHGREAVRRLREMADSVRQAALEAGYEDPRGTWHEVSEYDFDPLRVVLRVGGDAAQAQERLMRRGVLAEMAMGDLLVLLLPLMLGGEETERIAQALRACPAARAEPMGDRPEPLPLPECVMAPRKAALGETEEVDLDRAEGRIAAVSAGCYPPGVPLVVPGERIGRDALERLRNAGSRGRFGMRGEKIACVVPSSLTWTER